MDCCACGSAASKSCCPTARDRTVTMSLCFGFTLYIKINFHLNFDLKGPRNDTRETSVNKAKLSFTSLLVQISQTFVACCLTPPEVTISYFIAVGNCVVHPKLYHLLKMETPQAVIK